MKKREILTVLAAAALTLTAAAQGYAPAESHRLTKTINTEWTFNYFPQEEEVRGVYESPSFDDSAWSYVCVPHTWQTYETTGELHPFIASPHAKDNPYWWDGKGFYRKHFTLRPGMRGRKLFIEFDGVMKNCLAYMNGKLIGAAQRVPTPTGSTTILNAVVKGAVTVEQVNAQMKAEATESFGYNTDEIVSSDIIGMRYGSLFDATQTMVLPLPNGDTQVQVVSWYDNENSYTSQMVRTIKYFSEI